MSKTKKVISFFAGVGGIDLGFEKSGKFDVVYANEFDKNAKSTYEKNFDSKVELKDIRDVDVEKIPNADVLLAGFPCQPFSVAGYRKGFEDDRGSLFFETLRIIVHKKPEVVFLENVKNMVTHDHGNTFKVIREGLEQNGYYVKWKVLNAKDYGNIPQNRERIYIVGFLSKEAYDRFEFPSKIELTNPLTKYIDFKLKVDEKYYYNKEKNPTFYDELEKEIVSQDTVYQWRRQYVRENKNGVVPTLTANMGMGGHNVPLILSDTGIRKLTPRETFNIQGYPDKYVLPEIADGQLYKQAGNSVVVPVIERIANNIGRAIQGTEVLNDRKNGKFALIYTKMYERSWGESFVERYFDTYQEAVQYTTNNSELPLLSDEEYTRLVKRNGQHEFYSINANF
ncbi:DNA (cytosine-5)-methyltransferase 1 [Enterococcus sp. DIV0840]|nr:DNA cytosine methyltransferase [Enterococcus sp. DIV0849a]